MRFSARVVFIADKKAVNTTPAVPAGLDLDQLDVAVTVSRRTYIGTLLIPHSLLSLRAEEMVQNSSALGHGGLAERLCAARQLHCLNSR
jgi:hypothetical protein